VVVVVVVVVCSGDEVRLGEAGGALEEMVPGFKASNEEEGKAGRVPTTLRSGWCGVLEVSPTICNRKRLYMQQGRV
jgi:hypothetical protein